MGKATIWGDEIQEIYRIIVEDRAGTSALPGSVKKENIRQAYTEMLVSKIELGPRKLKVVLDSGNGTGGLFAPEFVRRARYEVIELFSEPDGRFPNHHPDPTKREYLSDLIDAVRKNDADVGIGFDGDSDRIGVVDDKGNMLFGDQLMLLFWKEILPKHPGADVIVEVKSSMILPEETEKLGGKPIWWKSGHSLVKAKMREIDALFSGEVSGHMFFADEFFGFDDAFYAAGRLLRILGIPFFLDYPIFDFRFKNIRVTVVASSYFSNQASNYALRKNIKLVDCVSIRRRCAGRRGAGRGWSWAPYESFFPTGRGSCATR